MNKLSSRLNRLEPSATLAMSQKSSEMKAQGIDIINMSVGGPSYNAAYNTVITNVELDQTETYPTIEDIQTQITLLESKI